MIDRGAFFAAVRDNPFPGTLTQSQVDGMNFILDVWEDRTTVDTDLRHLAYPLATAKWETSATMQPIEEHGKGAGQPYGQKDPETGQTYYGRGFVQLTWRDNYARADDQLRLRDKQSLEWHAQNALDPSIAAEILFEGMDEGWFRQGQTLGKWFSETKDDAYMAREIINGDKSKVPSWSGGARIGDLIAADHRAFLSALVAAETSYPKPDPVPEVTTQTVVYQIRITGHGPFEVALRLVTGDEIADD